MLYYEVIDMSEGIDLTKSNKSKRMQDFATTGFFVMDSNFKILYVIFAMVCQC